MAALIPPDRAKEELQSPLGSASAFRSEFFPVRLRLSVEYAVELCSHVASICFRL